MGLEVKAFEGKGRGICTVFLQKPYRHMIWSSICCATANLWNLAEWWTLSGRYQSIESVLWQSHLERLLWGIGVVTTERIERGSVIEKAHCIEVSSDDYQKHVRSALFTTQLWSFLRSVEHLVWSGPKPVKMWCMPCKQMLCWGRSWLLGLLLCFGMNLQNRPILCRHTVFESYLFCGNNGAMLLGLGLASLFNHSSTPNLDYNVNKLAKVRNPRLPLAPDLSISWLCLKPFLQNLPAHSHNTQLLFLAPATWLSPDWQMGIALAAKQGL